MNHMFNTSIYCFLTYSMVGIILVKTHYIWRAKIGNVNIKHDKVTNFVEMLCSWF